MLMNDTVRVSLVFPARSGRRSGGSFLPGNGPASSPRPPNGKSGSSSRSCGPNTVNFPTPPRESAGCGRNGMS